MSSVFDPPGNRREHFPHEPTDDQYLVEISVTKIYHVPIDADSEDEAIENAIDTFNSFSNAGQFFDRTETNEKIIEYPSDD